MNLRKLLSLFFITVFLFTFSIATYSGEEDIVARVGGEEIKAKELEEYIRIEQLINRIFEIDESLAQILLSTEEGKKVLKELKKYKLEELINNKLLEIGAKRKGYELSAEEKEELYRKQIADLKENNNITEEQLVNLLNNQGIASLEDYREIFLSNPNLNINLYLEKEVFAGISIDEVELREFYEKNKEEFRKEAGVEVSHILLANEKDAEGVYSRLNQGESFEELARNFSIDKGSAEQGGLLGYIEKGDVNEGFTELAFSLKRGQYSKPFKTQYGFHIIKVNEKISGGIPLFEEVKEEIENNLIGKKRQQILSELLIKLREEMKIEILI
jgi:parvulin-like peptidyl-prolyl isomerase